MARTEKEKKRLLVLGAALAVAVLLAGVSFLFARGDDAVSGVVVESGPVPAGVAPTEQGPAPAPVPTDGRAPLVFRGVDPFLPLVGSEPPGAEDSSQSGSADTSGQDPAGPASAVVAGQNVTLVDVVSKDGEKQARVDVDGKPHTVGTGDRFAGDYVLVAFEDPCVRLAYRDQSFRLCLAS